MRLSFPFRTRFVAGLTLCAAVVGRVAHAQQSTACAAPPSAGGARPSRVADLRDGAHQVVVNGVRLWYCVAGRGPADVPPVVFLHGGPGASSVDFAAIAGPGLERGLRMVYLDQRGSGRSERPWTNEYSMARLVEDLEGLRRVFGVSRIALLGHSFGGTLALEYAARFPERVARLVFVDGLSDAPAGTRAQCARLRALRPDAYARSSPDSTGRCDVFAALGREAPAFFTAIQFPDSTRRARRDSLVAASGLRNTGELQRALFSQGLLEYRFTGATRLTMPVLVLVGARDGMAGAEAPRALAASLPNARFLEYAASGHAPYLDETDRFVRDVTAFLTAPPGRRAAGAAGSTRPASR